MGFNSGFKGLNAEFNLLVTSDFVKLFYKDFPLQIKTTAVKIKAKLFD